MLNWKRIIPNAVTAARFGFSLVFPFAAEAWWLPLILVSLVVWILSYLLIRALSRYREFAADRGAARALPRLEAVYHDFPHTFAGT